MSLMDGRVKDGWPDTHGWTVVGGRSEGDAVSELPSDLWTLAWQSTDRSILVTDPLYGNQRTLWISRIIVDGQPREFASGEVSNGVYLFAVPGLGWAES